MKLRAQFIEDPEFHEKNRIDLDQMEAMIAETLAFAKNNNRLETRVKLDINSLLNSVCNDFADIGFDVSYHALDQNVAIKGRSIALRRAFNNLIENAVKYGNKADVRIETKRNTVIIIIDDEGAGIAEEQLEKVFEPFYRVDNSRSRQTGGTGLGLALARDIISALGGSIRLTNRNKIGLRVIVTLGTCPQ